LEKTEKEDWQRKYEDEKALTEEYMNERITLEEQLSTTRTQLAAV